VVLQAMGALGHSVWPELSRSVGGGHLAEARLILSRATRMSVGASFALVLVLAVAGPAVISWWTRGAVNTPDGLLYLLLLVVVCNTFWYTRFMVLLATNQHAQVAVFYLLGTATSLIVAVPLTAAFGLIGAAISLLAIDIAMAGVVLPRSLRIVGDTPTAFLHVLVGVPNGVRRALANVRSA
jgi:O-antigen/teichoic acid export membrane protein